VTTWREGVKAWGDGGDGMDEVLRQRTWTDDELRAAGFCYYERKKQLVMVRELPASEAPVEMDLGVDRVVVPAGYLICYDPRQGALSSLGDYDAWPVEPGIFAATYRAWDEPGWEPNEAERHLMQLGCRPFYKASGVWAQRLTAPMLVQSLESPEPVLVEPGTWVAVGPAGEPWPIADETFRERYFLPEIDG
jgi:hypothetical protein